MVLCSPEILILLDRGLIPQTGYAEGKCIMSSMNLFGKALKSYYEGNTSSELIVHTQDRSAESLPTSIFFRAADSLSIDKTALDLCKGKTLDVGAGSGVHSLYLQEHGFDIVALDISTDACEIMKSRGVRVVICADIMGCGFQHEFQTYLVLGRSIGAVGCLERFETFLENTKSALIEKGQIILNSINEPSKDNYNIRFLSFEFEGIKDEPVPWFDIGENLLIKVASHQGFLTEIVDRDMDQNYLAVLKVWQ
jgi:SAM-dependent methyltransferase